MRINSIIQSLKVKLSFVGKVDLSSAVDKTDFFVFIVWSAGVITA